jgi:predicted nucleotidyltransferase
MDEKLKTILAELRRKFEAIYGERLVQMVLFGSRARGDAKPGSDIDVMVVLKGLVNPGYEISRVSQFTASLSLQYDIVISCIFISEERFYKEQSPLLLNVRREGVVV